MMDVATQLVEVSDIVIIVGTSMQVYPAAGLVQYAPAHSKVYFVDPIPSLSSSEKITVFAENATTGIGKVISEIKQNF